ncbi:MAG: hypothetical protein V7L25_18585 [Nostoc sp.]|uniref:hypothetical protein n=1 Tax=Nostoc sp. TaxID=1180 RepID=UPI002FEEF3A2
MSQNNVASNPVSRTQSEDYICNLVTFEPLLFNDNCQLLQNLRLILTITFCRTEVVVTLDDGSEVNIIFGIKTGNLIFTLKNGRMPLNNRKTFDNIRYRWRVIHRGISQSPEWNFTLLNGSEFLEGALQNKYLGIIELLEVGKYFELEAIFKINVNLNHIKVICTDSKSVNKIQKGTEIACFLRELKNQYRLDNYVSKVVVYI